MTGDGRALDANPGVPPRLSDLTEEITRRLQSGEPFDADAYLALHPDWAGPILDLLPTLHELVRLGESLTRERASGLPLVLPTAIRKEDPCA